MRVRVRVWVHHGVSVFEGNCWSVTRHVLSLPLLSLLASRPGWPVAAPDASPPSSCCYTKSLRERASHPRIHRCHKKKLTPTFSSKRRRNFAASRSAPFHMASQCTARWFASSTSPFHLATSASHRRSDSSSRPLRRSRSTLFSESTTQRVKSSVWGWILEKHAIASSAHLAPKVSASRALTPRRSSCAWALWPRASVSRWCSAACTLIHVDESVHSLSTPVVSFLQSLSCSLPHLLRPPLLLLGPPLIHLRFLRRQRLARRRQLLP